MKLKLNFLKNEYIVIEVFEENIAWFNFFKNKEHENNYQPIVKKVKLCVVAMPTLSTLAPWTDIVQNTEYFKSQNYKLPYQLPEKFNYSQELLNTIHRFFTYNSTWALENCEGDMTGNTPIKPTSPNPFDSSFVPNNLPKFLTAISYLNHAVHKLEMLCTTENKTRVLTTIKENKILWINPRNNFDYTSNGWFPIGNILNEFQKSYTNDYPNVVMTEEIQGKSYLRAFIDNDDPTKLDVTGRYGSYGGFFIDTNNDRKMIYESQEFKNWLDLYDLKKEDLPLEWPLGQVINCSLPLTDFNADEFISIDFIDD